MITANVYLNFDGKTEEAFNFYKSVFGGEFTMFQRFGDMPGEHADPSEANRIMHVSLPLGKDSILMGSDTMKIHQLTMGNNFHISINTGSEAEADNVYGALSAGGAATMPMAKMFWGAYFGMCTDKYGVNWMVSCEPKK